ncbi:hypothetical protein [Asaia sp. VD9]|uniref:hypothetical protein n=1 Tax=Asaia sp. VD9 TaxID=3081235 RepID=UPI00301849CC
MNKILRAQAKSKLQASLKWQEEHGKWARSHGAGQFSWHSHAQQRRIDNRRVFTSPSRADRAASKARRASVTPVRGAK